MSLDFSGLWVSEEGNHLLITRIRSKPYRAKYVRKDGRLLFLNKLKLWCQMFPRGCPASVVGGNLVVELNGAWGPSIRLEPELGELSKPKRLVPFIEPSLHDGWEDVMGIQWLEPLSPFSLKEHGSL